MITINCVDCDTSLVIADLLLCDEVCAPRCSTCLFADRNGRRKVVEHASKSMVRATWWAHSAADDIEEFLAGEHTTVKTPADRAVEYMMDELFRALKPPVRA
jgi:hypothetical protein